MSTSTQEINLQAALQADAVFDQEQEQSRKEVQLATAAAFVSNLSDKLSSVLSSATNTPAPTASTTPGFTPFDFSQSAGMYQAIFSFLQQSTSDQDYVSRLVQLGAAIQQSALTQSQFWLNLISGPAGSSGNDPITSNPITDGDYADGRYSDLSVMNWILKNTSGSEQASDLQVVVSIQNQHNTLYNQSNTAYGALGSSTNENASNGTTGWQNALNALANGPVTLLQTEQSISSGN